MAALRGDLPRVHLSDSLTTRTSLISSGAQGGHGGDGVVVGELLDDGTALGFLLLHHLLDDDGGGSLGEVQPRARREAGDEGGDADAKLAVVHESELGALKRGVRQALDSLAASVGTLPMGAISRVQDLVHRAPAHVATHGDDGGAERSEVSLTLKRTRVSLPVSGANHQNLINRSRRLRRHLQERRLAAHSPARLDAPDERRGGPSRAPRHRAVVLVGKTGAENPHGQPDRRRDRTRVPLALRPASRPRATHPRAADALLASATVGAEDVAWWVVDTPGCCRDGDDARDVRDDPLRDRAVRGGPPGGGVDAFLVVFSAAGRVTAGELLARSTNSRRASARLFLDRAIVLFTHADTLEADDANLTEYLDGAPADLAHLLARATPRGAPHRATTLSRRDGPGPVGSEALLRLGERLAGRRPKRRSRHARHGGN